MRTPLRAALLAAPLLLAAALTGCGTAADGGDAAGAEASPSMSADEAGVAYAQCMRENGVHMEDPAPGQGPMLQVDGSVSRETVQAAQEACEEYRAAAGAGRGDDGEMQQKSQEFAECMRENGMEDFPDPEPGQPGVQMDGETREDPDFEDAIAECQPIFGGAGATPGGQG
jgi:hypothetical protein